VAHYRKGANAERELVHALFDRGFSVIRTAGSGKTSLPAPDLIAMRPGRHLAFECKAWAAGNLSIPIASMEEFMGWCDRAGVTAFVGWKIPRQGWVFLRPVQMRKTPKFYTINRKDAFAKGIGLEAIAGGKQLPWE